MRGPGAAQPVAVQAVIADLLLANKAQAGRSWSLAQAKGLPRSDGVGAVRCSCCTLLLHYLWPLTLKRQIAFVIHARAPDGCRNLLRSLGYEEREAGFRCLAGSPEAEPAWANVMRIVSDAVNRLTVRTSSRGVSCTDSCT
jgi:hypothetical protein